MAFICHVGIGNWVPILDKNGKSSQPLSPLSSITFNEVCCLLHSGVPEIFFCIKIIYLFLFCMYEFFYLYVCEYNVCLQFPQRPGMRAGFPGT